MRHHRLAMPTVVILSSVVGSLTAAGEDVSLSRVPAARTSVWKQYVKKRTADTARRAEHASKKLRHGGATMRFEYFTIGSKPKTGYPLYIALHGGGGAPPRVNDAQWKHMTAYYRDSMRNGIYAAPRGIGDTWNLHFLPRSYPLYDRLIENMILFEGVDANRVYLLGYSAGGDGVYQIVPRMPDRWAAANMSAGHHNNVNPTNLYRVPFLLQVGEHDSAYGRNKATVKFNQKLEALGKKRPDGYRHELFVHKDRRHNFIDRDPRGMKQQVMADPVAWLEKGDRRAIAKNTNAVAWLRRHVRDPLPARLVWDVTTRVRNQHYWLDIGAQNAESLGVGEIAVALDRDANTIVVERAGAYLRILLTQRMLDLSRPVTIAVGGKKFTGTVRPSRTTMQRTLQERGDPEYIFEAECVLERKGATWRVTGLSK